MEDRGWAHRALAGFRIAIIGSYAISLTPLPWHTSSHAVTTTAQPNPKEPAMNRFFTPRIDWAVSAVAVICLMGPLLMGVARSLGTGV